MPLIALSQQQHQVQAGETLYSIAAKYGVSIEQIIKQNKGITLDYFPAGATITIPASAQRELGIANSDCREMHKVQKGETIYGICTQYNLTEEQLRRANPSMQTPNFSLKAGKFLCIPFATPLMVGTPTAPQPNQAIRATLFLPLKSSGEEGKRCVEFSRGFISAAEALVEEGLNITLHLVNETANNASIEESLKQITQHQSDLIIGPIYPSHFEKMAAFSKEKHIRLVVPFSSKMSQVETQENIFLINSPEEQKATYAAELLGKTFKSPHTIFVTPASGTLSSFSRTLVTQLSAANLSTSKVTAKAVLLEWKAQLKTNYHNLFVISPETVEEAKSYVEIVRKLQTTYPAFTISLLINSDIFPFISRIESELFAANTYLLTPYYFNPYTTAAKQFIANYEANYKEPLLTFSPSMAALGYDIGYQLLKGGTTPAQTNFLPSVKPPFQSRLRFLPINKEGGYVNSNMLLIHYKPNRTIDQISL